MRCESLPRYARERVSEVAPVHRCLRIHLEDGGLRRGSVAAVSAWIRRASASRRAPDRLHSHITNTRQPSRLNLAVVRRSRSTFSRNFAFQNF